MKTYFAKYLPVEGEINEGNICREKYPINPKIINVIRINNDGMIKVKEDSLWYAPDALQKVKLFLCSRDIEIGDAVKYQDFDGSLTDYTVKKTGDKNDMSTLNRVCNKGGYVQGKYYKVIGEISSQATWVKEGEELDEENIVFAVYEPWEPWAQLPYEEWEETCDMKDIKIKGPCGHFH
jgi:hypothetical protein